MLTVTVYRSGFATQTERADGLVTDDGLMVQHRS
jgi:hypothetical protein